jgi:hypothetical protein
VVAERKPGREVGPARQHASERAALICLSAAAVAPAPPLGLQTGPAPRSLCAVGLKRWHSQRSDERLPTVSQAARESYARRRDSGPRSAPVRAPGMGRRRTNAAPTRDGPLAAANNDMVARTGAATNVGAPNGAARLGARLIAGRVSRPANTARSAGRARPRLTEIEWPPLGTIWPRASWQANSLACDHSSGANWAAR